MVITEKQISQGRCLEEPEILEAAFDEELDAPFASHILQCESCQGRIARVRSEMKTLRDSSEGFAAPAALPAISRLPAKTVKRAPVSEEEMEPAGTRVLFRIGDYLAVERLGAGGQAEAFRVIHREIHHELVLKRSLHPFNPRSLSQMTKQAAKFHAFDHPGIARVLDLQFDDGLPYVVMQFIRGVTLRQYVERHHPTPRRCAELMGQAARTMAACHREGIVHRDLTPSNILIDFQGQTKIIDFGLALFQGANDQPEDVGARSGTRGFMPSEQASGDINLQGPASDIAALGSALGYALLIATGARIDAKGRNWSTEPYGSPADIAALRSAGVPRTLTAIIDRAVAADPRQRFASADDLAEALERASRPPRPIPLSIKFLAAACLVIAISAAFTAALYRPLPAATQVPIRMSANKTLLEESEALPVKTNVPWSIALDVPRGTIPVAVLRDSGGDVKLMLSPEQWTHRRGFPYDHWESVSGNLGTDPTGSDLLVVACVDRKSDAGNMLIKVKDFLRAHPIPELPVERRLFSVSTTTEAEALSGTRGFSPAPTPELDFMNALRQEMSGNQRYFAALAFPVQTGTDAATLKP